MSLDFKVERFLRGLDVPCPMQLPTWMGSFSHEELGRLCPSARDRFTREEVFGDVFAAHEQAGKDPVESALDFFQRFYLPHDILRKVDRASMMVGLELRCPFLDTEFAEYANRLPAPLKLHGGVTKYLLKEGLREAGILPSAVIDRPKKGFGIPVARWLRGELRPALEQHLVADWPASLDLIDPQRVRDLVREHLARRANRAKELWSLLVLSLWTKSQAV